MTESPSSNGHNQARGAVAPAAESAPAPAAPRRRTRWQKALAGLVVAYSLTIVGLCFWMFWQGDREWLATLVLFGPRWLCGIPLPFLAVAASIWYRRLLWVLAVTAIVLVFPFIGFKANWPAPISTPVGLRVLTCNVDRSAFDVGALAELILVEEPDVVALQEVHWQSTFIWPEGWHVLSNPEYTLASRWPITEEAHCSRPHIPPAWAAICYRVQLPDREVRVFDLHLSTPRDGLEAVLTLHPAEGAPELDAILEIRATESQVTSDWIAGFEGPKIVLGDFNMPGESTIFRRDWTSLSDAFAGTGWGFGFTKISGEGYFTYGARIDHILYSDHLQCIRSWVAEPVGSDHLPLFAEFR